MTLLSPGALSTRPTRSSKLFLGWRASDGTVQPYTGQLAEFSSTAGTAAGPVVGSNGVSVTAGSGMPRFTQADADGLVRLGMRGDSGSFDVEQVTIGVGMPIQAFSILFRVVSMYAKGSSTGTNVLFSWGSDRNVGAGTWVIQRRSTFWETIRSRGGSDPNSFVTEPGSITYPVDVMATLSSGGSLIVSTRDAAGVIATGNTTTLAALVTAGEFLSGIAVGSTAISGQTGGWWRVESYKMARGVQTFSSFDSLA